MDRHLECASVVALMDVLADVLERGERDRALDVDVAVVACKQVGL